MRQNAQNVIQLKTEYWLALLKDIVNASLAGLMMEAMKLVFNVIIAGSHHIIIKINKLKVPRKLEIIIVVMLNFQKAIV